MLTIQSLPHNIIDNLNVRENGYYSISSGSWIESTNVHTYDKIKYNSTLIMKKDDGGNGGGYVSFFDSDGIWISGRLITFINNEYEIKNPPENTDYVAITFWNNQSEKRIIRDEQKYPAQATVNRKQIVNGEQTLSLSFSVSEMNMDFLPDLSFLWKAEFDKEQYTIINPSTEAIVKRKSVTAILKFFTDFGGMYLQDEVEDKSMTALNAYTELFANTGKRVHLVDNFYANTLNYQKNQSRLERFHYYNERFKAEFIVRGDDVYLYNKIGSYKPDVRIDEDLNVKSATVDFDSENFFTWCKCYYDLEESDEGVSSENYRQEKVYVDDALYAIYGDKEGPAIYQGNIRNETTMLEYAEDVQRKSIKVSHSVDLIDLQKQGYGEFIFHIGDVIRLSLSSINTTLDIRIVDIDETFVENDLGDWERTDLKLTLGETSKVQSYKSAQSSALQELQDWLDKRKTIPPGFLDAAIQRAAEIVNGDTDSVMQYRKDRLVGWHSKNEGNNVMLNVSGLIFHRNGVPTTGATYEGIIADAITAGTINTHNITILGVSENGDVMTMDGSIFKVWNVNDPSKYVEISKGEIHVYKGGFKLTGFDHRVVFEDGLMRGQPVANLYRFENSAVESDGSRDLLINHESYQRVYVVYDQWRSNRLDLLMNFSLNWDSVHSFRYFDIRVVDMYGSNVVYTQRVNVYKEPTGEQNFLRMSVDLKNYFNSIVDYRNLHLYIEVRMINPLNQNTALFRVNKGEVYD